MLTPLPLAAYAGTDFAMNVEKSGATARAKDDFVDDESSSDDSSDGDSLSDELE